MPMEGLSVLRGWCKACGERQAVDPEWGHCGICGSPYLTCRRPGPTSFSPEAEAA